MEALDQGCCRPLLGRRLVGVGGGGVGKRGREPGCPMVMRDRSDIGGKARRGRRNEAEAIMGGTPTPQRGEVGLGAGRGARANGLAGFDSGCEYGGEPCKQETGGKGR